METYSILELKENFPTAYYHAYDTDEKVKQQLQNFFDESKRSAKQFLELFGCSLGTWEAFVPNRYSFSFPVEYILKDWDGEWGEYELEHIDYSVLGYFLEHYFENEKYEAFKNSSYNEANPNRSAIILLDIFNHYLGRSLPDIQHLCDMLQYALDELLDAYEGGASETPFEDTFLGESLRKAYRYTCDGERI